MSYVAKTLGPSESVLMRARFPVVYHLNSVLLLLLFGIIIIGVFAAFERWLRSATTEIVVTDRRFIYKRGFVARATDELGLRKIEEIHLRQSFWQRLFGMGSLQINGTGDAKIQTPLIGRPLQFRKMIEDAIERFDRTNNVVDLRRPGNIDRLPELPAPHHADGIPRRERAS